jgi:amino acid transporter
MQPSKNTRQLNWFLAWAVVFCDIGTSVYYVPGILYGHVKDATPFFVLLTTGGFVLLALKYIEISWRNPEGGGVVTITTKAFGRFRIPVHRQRFSCVGLAYCGARLHRSGRTGSA